MTGRIVAVREDLAAALAPMGTVFAQMPDRWSPPAVLLQPDDPWISVEDGTPYRSGDVHYKVVLIVRPGTNVAQDNTLTDLVEQALDAIHESSHSWTVERVVAPYDLQVGEAVYLAVRLHVTRKTRLTTD